ncbi:hypothetical protein [Caballeronia sp. EK]|jgi:hypothetical protein|nr:hypothetical protein [Caballeronia sp. EK]
MAKELLPPQPSPVPVTRPLMPHTAKDEFVNTLVHAYYVGMNQRL